MDKNNIFHQLFYDEVTNEPDYRKWLYLGLLVCFIVLATVISSTFSRDSVGYNDYIIRFGSTGWNELYDEMFYLEGLFVFLSKVVYKFGLDYVFLFLVYAAISLSVKFYLIYKHSADKVLSLAFFSSYYFILQDSTQIRFSIAVAFSYLGLHFLADNRKLLFSVIVISSAILFHTAIVVFIVMLIFKSSKSYVWIIGMIVIALVLYPLNLNLAVMDLVGSAVSYFNLEDTRIKILYRVMLQPSSDVFLGVFARPAILSYICAAVIFQYRNKFSAFEVLCFNAFLLSIFCYILLKDIPDLQVRFRDMFVFSLVFLVPFLCRGLSIFLGGKLAYALIMLYLCVHFIKFTFYSDMLIF